MHLRATLPVKRCREWTPHMTALHRNNIIEGHYSYGTVQGGYESNSFTKFVVSRPCGSFKEANCIRTYCTGLYVEEIPPCLVNLHIDPLIVLIN